MFVIDTEKHDYIILQINAENIFFISIHFGHTLIYIAVYLH